MGIFDSVLNGLFGLGGMFIQNGFNRQQNERQYEQEFALQMMNQAYNSNEAEKNRGFQAQQAEISRDWEEEMYNKYQSPSALMAQARDAGINPLAVFGNAQSGPGGVSTPSGSVASSSPGHAPQAPYMNGTVLVDAFAKMAGLVTEIENINADTRKKNAEALITEIDSLTRGDINSANLQSIIKSIEVSDVDISLKSAKINEISSKILNTDADTEVKRAKLGEIAANIANTNADTKNKGAQYGAIIASIANTQADTKVKEKMVFEVIARTQDLKALKYLHVAQTSVAKQDYRKISKDIDLLTQKYSHLEIMNGLDRLMRGYEVPDNNFDYLMRKIANDLVSIFSLSAIDYTRTQTHEYVVN